MIKSYRSLFSLTELLVVTALLVVLTSLVMPSLNKLMRSSLQIECSSRNLGAIYLGIASYTDDHNYSLPGAAGNPAPRVNEVPASFSNSIERKAYSELQYYLIPYLEVSHSGKWGRMASMQCPENLDHELSWEPDKRKSFYLAQHLNHEETVAEILSPDPLSGGFEVGQMESTKPFGQPEFYRTSDGFHRAGSGPMKLFQVKGSEDHGLYDAFRDNGNVWIVPTYPVHQNNSINLMFLDGHVEVYYPDLIEMKKNNKYIEHIL